MRVFARVAVADHPELELEPGDIVGRLTGARLCVNDPRISEAHALVSLRGSALKLLALRGRLAVDGVATGEVTLTPGLVVTLAPGIDLHVRHVALPATVLALETTGRPLQVLPAVASVYADGALIVGFAADADVILWFDSDGLNLRRPGAPDTRVDEGDVISIGARELRLVASRIDSAGVASTVGTTPTPIRLILRYDTVHITSGSTTGTLDGLAARLVCELALIRGPVEWKTLANEVWPDETDEALLRRKFDASLARLRRRLREIGIGGHLLRNDGRGRFELMLGPDDVVQDEM